MPTTVPILWLHGADAVGKSTVAWEIYARLSESGVGIAYVDTDYLGFCSPGFDDGSELVARNLKSMWQNFEAAGARCLVVGGIIVTSAERAAYEQAIPGGAITLGRLRATPETLADRIIRRGRIEGADSDGAVSGLTMQGLREYADRAAAFAAKLDADDLADFAVDTDTIPVPAVADEVLRLSGGWPDA